MKRIPFILCLALCFALAACGTAAEESPADTTMPPQTETAVEEATALATEPPEMENVAVETTVEPAEESKVHIAETEPPKTYYHVAIKGAVVTSYDGTGRYTFKKVCAFCGKEQPGSISHHSWGGTYHSSFTCVYCHETQQFEIETKEN